jgi:SAM-dependent methyltransferase
MGSIPEQEALGDFYKVEHYYTHEGRPGVNGHVPGSPPGLLDKALGHLAWRADWGTHVDSAWFAGHFGPGRQTICDLGCGNGGLGASLQAVGHRVIGIEPDLQARDVASGQGLTVYPGTAEAPPPEVGGGFDVVLMIHVLEHCRDPLAALANAGRLLSPGGTLVVEVPNNAALGLARAGVTWHWLDVPRHLSFFTPQSLSAACVAAGLRVEATEFCGYARQFSLDWVGTERQIWDCMRRVAPHHPLPPRNSSWKAWRLLAATLLAPRGRKYDSARVLASRL